MIWRGLGPGNRGAVIDWMADLVMCVSRYCCDDSGNRGFRRWDHNASHCLQGILLELPLASFFLKKLLHMGCDLHDLPSLDAELYKSLLFLRDYEGDVDDLALSFTVTDGALGQNKEVCLLSLLPIGSSMIARLLEGQRCLSCAVRVAFGITRAHSYCEHASTESSFGRNYQA